MCWIKDDLSNIRKSEAVEAQKNIDCSERRATTRHDGFRPQLIHAYACVSMCSISPFSADSKCSTASAKPPSSYRLHLSRVESIRTRITAD